MLPSIPRRGPSAAPSIPAVALAVLALLPAWACADDASVRAARREAETTHAVVETLLQAVHDRLYRPDEAMPLPAAVFRETFDSIGEARGVGLRWLAVDGVAMNDDHRPRDEFEREAARRLARGETAVERVEGGVYRRVGGITLRNHCLKCHVPDRKSLEDRTAGLVIAVPLERPEEAGDGPPASR